MDHRQLVRTLSYGRIAVGGSLVALPGRAGAGWIGDAATDPAVKVFTRALGIRDLVVGLGTAKALDAGEPARSWVVLGAACDAVDFAATLLAIRHIGLRRALPVLAVAGAAAAVGLTAADHVDV